MRFAPESDHGANAGLRAARDFLEPVKGRLSRDGALGRKQGDGLTSIACA